MSFQKKLESKVTVVRINIIVMLIYQILIKLFVFYYEKHLIQQNFVLFWKKIFDKNMYNGSIYWLLVTQS